MRKTLIALTALAGFVAAPHLASAAPATGGAAIASALPELVVPDHVLNAQYYDDYRRRAYRREQWRRRAARRNYYRQQRRQYYRGY